MLVLGRTGVDATYLALQRANLHGPQELAGLVAVADILESFRGILARNVEQDLLATTKPRTNVSRGCPTPRPHRACERWGGMANLRVLVDELGRVVDLVVDDHVQVTLGVVLRNILIREFGGHRDGVLLGICREAVRKVSGGFG